MAKLSAKTRDKLKKSQFGLPGSRAYPMEDRSHAANAKARASEERNAGKLSDSKYRQVVAKANRVLARGK